MSDDEDDDKQHEPSQRRLDEARKRGEVPVSVDIAAAASYGGLLLAALVAGLAVLRQTGEFGMAFLDRPELMAPLFTAGGRASVLAAASPLALAIAPLFALPMLGVLLALIAQRALVFAPEKLMPKLSRISPLGTAKHKFGREGLFDFARSAVKMLGVGLILGLHLSIRFPEIVASLYLPPVLGVGVMLRIMVEFLFLVFLLACASGAIDLLWQRAQHVRRNRMSHKEMRDEVKDSEGDPYVKAQNRQRGQEIAMNRMLQDVALADVVIVNPTHYAIALRWKRSDKTAPICVAKGVDELAARIRERAVIAGVPLHSDPPTARAIYASVEIGHPVRPEQYKPVAAAIRFAEALRKRKKVTR